MKVELKFRALTPFTPEPGVAAVYPDFKAALLKSTYLACQYNYVIEGGNYAKMVARKPAGKTCTVGNDKKSFVCR